MVLGEEESVLFREVSSFQGVLIEVLPLYTRTCRLAFIQSVLYQCTGRVNTAVFAVFIVTVYHV